MRANPRAVASRALVVLACLLAIVPAPALRSTVEATSPFDGSLQEDPANEAAVRNVVTAVADAVNKGDAAAFARVFAEDGDHTLLTRDGARQGVRGPAMVEKHFKQLFSKRPPGFSRKISAHVTSVRFVTPEVAILDGSWNFTEGVSQDGRHQPPSAEPFLVVVAKKAGRWLIVASRRGPAEPL